MSLKPAFIEELERGQHNTHVLKGCVVLPDYFWHILMDFLSTKQMLLILFPWRNAHGKHYNVIKFHVEFSRTYMSNGFLLAIAFNHFTARGGGVLAGKNADFKVPCSSPV